jgi:hypothetical protein
LRKQNVFMMDIHMTHHELKLWLNGYIELSKEDFLTQKQRIIIQNHAALVKAVEGYLDENLTCFLAELDRFFLDYDTIPFAEFKNIALQFLQKT